MQGPYKKWQEEFREKRLCNILYRQFKVTIKNFCEEHCQIEFSVWLSVTLAATNVHNVTSLESLIPASVCS